jgi:prophage maintenance system killer protein/prophage antirepressor-like protein
MPTQNNVIIYQNSKGALEVNLKQGQIWLTQDQISKLFVKDRTVITKHIKNIYAEEELEVKSTSAKFAQLQTEGNREVSRNIEFYNLDMILSIGYRVNSKIATKFRQWANTILKEYITKGYSVNPEKLSETKAELRFLIENKKLLSEDTFETLLDKYVDSLVTLNQYDENKIPEIIDEQSLNIGLDECMDVISRTKTGLLNKGEAWEGFGKELDNKFNSTIGAINQTFGNLPVYNRSQKLANLLYLIVKNHSFVDGNKRIGAILFTYFCAKVEIVIDPNNLVTLTLLVAQSDPKDKENLIKLIQKLII